MTSNGIETLLVRGEPVEIAYKKFFAYANQSTSGIGNKYCEQMTVDSSYTMKIHFSLNQIPDIAQKFYPNIHPFLLRERFPFPAAIERKQAIVQIRPTNNRGTEYTASIGTHFSEFNEGIRLLNGICADKADPRAEISRSLRGEGYVFTGAEKKYMQDILDRMNRARSWRHVYNEELDNWRHVTVQAYVSLARALDLLVLRPLHSLSHAQVQHMAPTNSRLRDNLTETTFTTGEISAIVSMKNENPAMPEWTSNAVLVMTAPFHEECFPEKAFDTTPWSIEKDRRNDEQEEDESEK